MKAPNTSAPFRYIERLHDGRSWGRFLDAGTGLTSIRWVLGLVTDQWTAVTGAPGDAARVRAAVSAKQRPQDQIVLGNWADPHLLEGDVYDTVLADHLLGAVEGFAPCFQPYLFARLRPLTRQALYVTGLEPYVPTDPPDTRAGRVVWQLGRFRDACLLLGGDMPYREYPAPWVVDHVQRAGFKVHEVKRFALTHKERFVNAQIDMCAPRLDGLADQSLARSLRDRGEALRAEALEVIDAEGALRHGHDYAIAAEPV